MPLLVGALDSCTLQFEEILPETVVLKQLSPLGMISYPSYPENPDSVQASQVEIWINLKEEV
jgi:hypothetical protein